MVSNDYVRSFRDPSGPAGDRSLRGSFLDDLADAGGSAGLQRIVFNDICAGFGGYVITGLTESGASILGGSIIMPDGGVINVAETTIASIGVPGSGSIIYIDKTGAFSMTTSIIKSVSQIPILYTPDASTWIFIGPTFESPTGLGYPTSRKSLQDVEIIEGSLRFRSTDDSMSSTGRVILNNEQVDIGDFSFQISGSDWILVNGSLSIADGLIEMGAGGVIQFSTANSSLYEDAGDMYLSGSNDVIMQVDGKTSNLVFGSTGGVQYHGCSLSQYAVSANYLYITDGALSVSGIANEVLGLSDHPDAFFAIKKPSSSTVNFELGTSCDKIFIKIRDSDDGIILFADGSTTTIYPDTTGTSTLGAVSKKWDVGYIDTLVTGNGTGDGLQLGDSNNIIYYDAGNIRITSKTGQIFLNPQTPTITGYGINAIIDGGTQRITLYPTKGGAWEAHLGATSSYWNKAYLGDVYVSGTLELASLKVDNIAENLSSDIITVGANLNLGSKYLSANRIKVDYLTSQDSSTIALEASINGNSKDITNLNNISATRVYGTTLYSNLVKIEPYKYQHLIPQAFGLTSVSAQLYEPNMSVEVAENDWAGYNSKDVLRLNTYWHYSQPAGAVGETILAAFFMTPYAPSSMRLVTHGFRANQNTLDEYKVEYRFYAPGGTTGWTTLYGYTAPLSTAWKSTLAPSAVTTTGCVFWLELKISQKLQTGNTGYTHETEIDLRGMYIELYP